MSVFADLDADADVKNDAISSNADANIRSTSTRGGQDVDFFIFADADIDEDIYF